MDLVDCQPRKPELACRVELSRLLVSRVVPALHIEDIVHGSTVPEEHSQGLRLRLALPKYPRR